MDKQEPKDKQRKYPKAVAGIFIFNEKNELFLMKSSKWQNKYVCPGGRIEEDETITQAVKREAKEETNLDITDIRLFNVVDGLNLGDSYSREDDHLIFLDHTARVGGGKVKLNSEATEYKWLPLEKWLEQKENKFGPTVYAALKKLKEAAGEDFEHKYKRALADYQNLVKQQAREKAEFVKFANEQLILEIIPVYDNLKMVLEHADEDKHDQWLEGIKHVVKQFRDKLHMLGVEEIKTAGAKYDPEVMEALEGKGEKVKKEVKPGYKLNGKVVLPAKVIVGE